LSRIFELLIQKYITVGDLQITTAGGSTYRFGDQTGALVAIRFLSKTAQWKVLWNSELCFGEAYVRGDIIVEKGTLTDVIAIFLRQPTGAKFAAWTCFGKLTYPLRRRWQQLNSISRARRNVKHHYDIDDKLYELFLGIHRQYSCAYFEHASQSLEDAQLAKMRHLAAKLITKPGQRILDIGCGWGGLAIYLAQTCAAHVLGITLSPNQRALADGRSTKANTPAAPEFRLEDYRSLTGIFDRIVSVGMFEHVGVGFYDMFFKKCADLLDARGVIVLSSIGRSEGPNLTNPWIAKYIFPGGYIPALSEVLPAVERAGLLVTDIEILRLHYADTITVWRERFLLNREVLALRFGPNFVRMWDYYLAASELAFRESAMMVFQLQLTKRQDVVPLTREYIDREAIRLQEIERSHHALTSSRENMAAK
jgi:cyclopropane-fatty-acyl-phospholipid synthase